MQTIKVKGYKDIPENYTGVVEWGSWAKHWCKEGIIHRVDGPAVERVDGTKEWYLDGKQYFQTLDISDKVFLGIEKGKYGLKWLRFMTGNGIEEFPIIPGLNYKIAQPLEDFLKNQ